MISHEEEIYDEKQELLDTFKAGSVGRGVWFVMEKLVSMLLLGQMYEGFTDKFHLLTIHSCFMMYCENIYCLVCRHHAAEYIGTTRIIRTITSGDKRIVQNYFEWLYNFHKLANHNAKKESPPLRDVMNFYLGEWSRTQSVHQVVENPIQNSSVRQEAKGSGQEAWIGTAGDALSKTTTSSINENVFTYDRIQVGVWHFFFMLATKCHQAGQVSAVYYLLLQFMSSLSGRPGALFREFTEKHKFTDALLKNDINIQELCISFFDWIYALHSYMNTKMGIKVYDQELMKDTYYNLEFCDRDCDQ